MAGYPMRVMLRTLARRVTIKTLDAVVDRARRSPRSPVRALGAVVDRARARVGLDRIEATQPMPQWGGTPVDQPMWDSDRKKRDKWRVDQGITKPDADAPSEPEELPIKVYIKRGCPSCRAAMDLLHEREIQFDQVDVKGDAATASWLKLVTGRSTTPQIFIFGENIGGFDDLRELDHSGELQKRLEAGPPAKDEDDAAPPKRTRLPVVHPERSPFEALDDDQWQAEAIGDELEGEELVARVREVLDECRPMVQADGGDIELIDVQSDVVHVTLTGNCVGCPSSQATLKQGIERRLRSRIPQIREVASPQLDQRG